MITIYTIEEYLSILRKGKGRREQRIARVDADLHGVLGVDQLQEHVQELSLISRSRHDVPAVIVVIVHLEFWPSMQRGLFKCHQVSEI